MRIVPKSAVLAALAFQTTAFAIDATYRRNLERSGCTQVSELQGCDIHRSRAENAKAGFAVAKPAGPVRPGPGISLVGEWAAVRDSEAPFASIQVDSRERVRVEGRKVRARRIERGLEFRSGSLVYRIHVDGAGARSGSWTDSATGSTGPVVSR